MKATDGGAIGFHAVAARRKTAHEISVSYVNEVIS